MYPNNFGNPYGQYPPQGFLPPYPPQNFAQPPQYPPQPYNNLMVFDPNNPYAYRTINFGNYQFKPYGYALHFVKEYAHYLFMKYDNSQIGFLNIVQLNGALNEFMSIVGGMHLNFMDVAYLMRQFDHDGTGNINFWEIRYMLKLLGGHKHYGFLQALPNPHKF